MAKIYDMIPWAKFIPTRTRFGEKHQETESCHWPDVMDTKSGTLRVLSWNLFNENTDTQRLVNCIRSTTPDIALIQEALPSHVSILTNYFDHVVTARDYICRGELCHLAIASRLELNDVKVVEHFSETKSPSSPLARWVGWTEFLDSISVTIRLNDTNLIRVVVLHTSAAVGPSHRQKEIHSVLESHFEPALPLLFAGDFNCFAKPWLTPILAIPLAYRLSDVFICEKRALNATLGSCGLHPAVSGVTLPRWRQQTDQIFFKGLRLTDSQILREQFGSDHRPLIAEFA